MIAADLVRAMQAFDDAALTTMANAGLLRRAQRDLESGKIALNGVDGGTAALSVDGQVVAITAAGPAAATCDCPAAGVCRHRLGAALFLRGYVDEAAAGEDITTVEPADPLDIITAISPTDAQKFAGRPGWRAAIELQSDLTAVEPNETAIAVRFVGLDDPILILRGQGMDGIISKASKAVKKAYHAAAIIAARRHFDLPDGVEVESAPEAATAAPPTAPDPAFIAQVQAALADTARLGFNLAPEPLEENLFALSVSSRADAFPRLASVLRAIAAALRQKRARAFEHDAGRMLELCALAHALCKAAGAIDPMDARFAAITGQVRREYELYEPITLTGCGAAVWRTGGNKGGARGVTAYFLEEASGRFFTVSLARGAGQDPTFEPAAAYRQQSVWQAASLADLTHARLTLNNAGVAEGGRLSAGKDVRAVVEAADAPLPIDHPASHQDWAALHTTLSHGFSLGLSASAAAQMALLSPTNSARPYFDELTQRLVWPVCDAAGRWMALTLDHDERSEAAMARFEKYVEGLWRGMVLVRAVQQGGRVTLSPVTLYGNGAPLSFTIPPLRWGAKDKGNWLKRLWSGRGQGLTMAPPTASARAVDAAWMHLIDRLEAGPQVARMLNDKRAAHAARLSDYGMARLSDLVAGVEEGASVFDAAYALLLARQQRAQLPFLA